MDAKEEILQAPNGLGRVEGRDDAEVQNCPYEDGFGELCKLKQNGSVREY